MKRWNQKPKLFIEAPMDRNQPLLFPPTLDDLVPLHELVRVFCRMIDEIDTNSLLDQYKGGGAPAYDPIMMLKMMLFGLVEGIRSSRRLEQMLRFDVRYMWIMGMCQPDYRTIARFRRRHEETIKRIFEATVKHAETLGLILLETVAVDGTKIEADVSRNQVMDKDRIDKRVTAIEAKVESILREIEETDKSEDENDRADKQKKLYKIVERMKKQKEKLTQAKEELSQDTRTSIALTDTESRVMHTRNGERSAYNAQAVVDSKIGIIIAADVTQHNNDVHQLKPMMDQVGTNVSRFPDKVLADTGYQSGKTLQYAKNTKSDLYISLTGPTNSEIILIQSTYDEDTDTYTSADGRVWRFAQSREYSGRPYRD